MKLVMEILEKLQKAESFSEIPDILHELAQLIEFDYYLFGMAIPSSITHYDILRYDNYPKEWSRCYEEQGYAKRDPIVQYSIHNNLPTVWSQISESSVYKEEDKQILWEAECNGLKSGFSIPVHGACNQSGIFSFAADSGSANQKRKRADAIPIIQMIIPALQDAIKRLRVSEKIDSPVKLTKREVECLTWATEGKSSWEISQILGCSERTAIFHLTNAANKLGATNRYQAISKALISGIINPYH